MRYMFKYTQTTTEGVLLCHGFILFIDLRPFCGLHSCILLHDLPQVTPTQHGVTASMAVYQQDLATKMQCLFIASMLISVPVLKFLTGTFHFRDLPSPLLMYHCAGRCIRGIDRPCLLMVSRLFSSLSHTFSSPSSRLQEHSFHPFTHTTFKLHIIHHTAQHGSH